MVSLLDLSLWLMNDPEPMEVIGSTYNYVSKGMDQVNLWGNFDASAFEVDDHATAVYLVCQWSVSNF